MPIRFRCAYCNQLMGIARRKAGTVVRCPKCAGQVVVPQPEGYEEDGPVNPQPANTPSGAGQAGPARAGEGGLFERSDFPQIFDEAPVAVPQAPPPPAHRNPAAGNPRPANVNPPLPEYEAVPLGPMKSPARGVFLTSGILALVSALVVILMGMAFFLGLLLGRSSAPP